MRFRGYWCQRKPGSAPEGAYRQVREALAERPLLAKSWTKAQRRDNPVAEFGIGGHISEVIDVEWKPGSAPEGAWGPWRSSLTAEKGEVLNLGAEMIRSPNLTSEDCVFRGRRRRWWWGTGPEGVARAGWPRPCQKWKCGVQIVDPKPEPDISR